MNLSDKFYYKSVLGFSLLVFLFSHNGDLYIAFFKSLLFLTAFNVEFYSYIVKAEPKTKSRPFFLIVQRFLVLVYSFLRLVSIQDF